MLLLNGMKALYTSENSTGRTNAKPLSPLSLRADNPRKSTRQTILSHRPDNLRKSTRHTIFPRRDKISRYEEGNDDSVYRFSLSQLCKRLPVDCNIKYEHGDRDECLAYKHSRTQKRKPLRGELKITTFNVRTLNETGKKFRIAAMAEKYNIDIIGLQEHRLSLKADTTIYCEHISNTDYVYMYASSENGTGGVGFVIKTKYVNHIQNVKKVSSSSRNNYLPYNKCKSKNYNLINIFTN